MSVIEVNGATIDYCDTGSEGKPVVVLIHGWLSAWDAQFSPEIEWLQPHYRVIAPTRRGYGRSGPKPRQYSRDFYRRDAEDIAAFLDALDVDQAHIVGFSDGGEVALLMPIIRPDLVRSVVAWGAVGFFGPEFRDQIEAYWPPTWLGPERRDIHGVTPEQVDQMVRGWMGAMLEIIDSGGNISRNEAHLIACPLLLMLGQGDPLNPEYAGRQLVERVPDGQLVMFDCGHAIHREQPELFRQTLWEFLQRIDAAD